MNSVDWEYPCYKQLTPENWLEPDELLNTEYYSVEEETIGETMNGELWLEQSLQHQFSSDVPPELHELLNVARAAIAYGFLYYPLYALGTQQIFRIGESAVSKYCEAHGGPHHSAGTFATKIDWLFLNGHISDDDKKYWHIIRQERNDASHPQEQKLIPPPTALGMLRDVVFSVNLLYKPVQDILIVNHES